MSRYWGGEWRGGRGEAEGVMMHLIGDERMEG